MKDVLLASFLVVSIGLLMSFTLINVSMRCERWDKPEQCLTPVQVVEAISRVVNQ